MGEKQSKIEQANNDAVDFGHFDVLRSIGRGSFGKVCIVKKKKTPSQVFAMKYMNKLQSWKQGYIENILNELYILSKLQHPFLVNLWFTFQDEEDIFMVSDLLLGGDLRYHINKNVIFTPEDIRLYLWEIASVLDYLKSKQIIHRDIKPDNVLLDEKGHVHLTDFNTATVLTDSRTFARSFAGTYSYAAPEVHQSAARITDGYTYTVDWWSLAVTVYELLRHKRPFGVCSEMKHTEAAKIILQTSPSYPRAWPQPLKVLFEKLFEINPSQRIASFSSLCETEFCQTGDLNQVCSGQLSPNFVPSNRELNYDPSYELEEMIIESNPLHKKKRRTSKIAKSRKKLQAKRSNGLSEGESETPEETALREIEERFIPFNRERLTEESSTCSDEEQKNETSLKKSKEEEESSEKTQKCINEGKSIPKTSSDIEVICNEITTTEPPL